MIDKTVHQDIKSTFMKLFLLTFIIFITVLSSEPNLFLPDCKIDHEKFCKEILQPKAKITQCLLEHNDNLSDACKSSLKILTDKVRTQMKDSCKDDVNKYCKWIIPGGGRIIKCLFKNESSLSNSCRKSLNE
jgi:hypothetical protein